MSFTKIQIKTSGERFYNITEQIKECLGSLLNGSSSGVLHIFVQHTSCGLTINESYDPSAKEDLERFLKHLAPRNLAFIEHTDEGEDDSPSHMKTMLVNQNLGFIVEDSQLQLGTWQGIYLCEFRDSPKTRSILIKYQRD
ncbi:secondary thiamine-phosphate synthase enzyme YjbQ [Halobacteriovorax sp. HLS]|uniref:secondary thiamine-phosphate synthase enzyme YjbQ n=1 Tax=Halobacteriovorax sp. HLS TaxID=2234000 RepID=UPI0013E37AF3|nr:secondary thiamine-phosphate synthase enzyme YjbQ [Halobacteriovorax sp. HLS]